ncbi:MAG TPA: hypothetical protein V6C84_12110 [Coleofasciculaceae cyanobacterium]
MTLKKYLPHTSKKTNFSKGATCSSRSRDRPLAIQRLQKPNSHGMEENSQSLTPTIIVCHDFAITVPGMISLFLTCDD